MSPFSDVLAVFSRCIEFDTENKEVRRGSITWIDVKWPLTIEDALLLLIEASLSSKNG